LSAAAPAGGGGARNGAGRKPLRLTMFTFPPFVHHYAEGWRHPQDMAGGLYLQSEPEVWAREARALEEMKFDALFVGDVGGIFNSHPDGPDQALRLGTQSVQFFAPALAQLAADAAPRLGVISTISTVEMQPWTTARMLNSMDHLTKGRVGWNVVTSANRGLAENLGSEPIGHDQRYEIAEEYLELCYRLWESWDPDALVLDQESGLFADPAKVHEVNFEGEHFRCRGPLAMPRSPQTHPVIVQAGQSDRGRDLAARHAEVMFALTPTLPAMQEHYADVKARLAKFGREPDDLAVLPAVMPIVGASEAEAEEKYATMMSIATVEAGLNWVSGYTGWDFSSVPPETPLSDLDPTEFYGVQSAFTMANPRTGDLDPTPHMRKGPESSAPTVADLGLAHAEGIAPKIVGTAPQVADQLEQIVDENGADGFMVSAVHHPLSAEEFAPVVAELQRRGRFRREYEGSTLRDRLGTRPLPAARGSALA
jgi:FMN-dependent oxidoreductase (nitrilotriacetate monooxygenase family)